MRVRVPASGWRPRDYQLKLWSYLERGGREAVAVWHRRAGKDEVGLHRACVAAHERPANYWHMLPEAAQARKAIWDAVNPKTGIRRVNEAFPLELRESTQNHEMFIKFKCGSTWQVVGSDNFNSLVGASPAGVVYSEWALAKPSARAFLRPIFAENNGWELFIYTPRGRNHGLTTLRAAEKTQGSFSQVLTVDDTHAISTIVLAKELDGYIKEYGQEEGLAFYRQEYYSDFNAAVLGSILGRYVDKAERQGRINDAVAYDPEGSPIEISSDIGRSDTAAWWFWQPKLSGFSLVDYDDGNGLDAEEWCVRLDKRLKDKNYKLGQIWLPHDAKSKTFAAKHSAQEIFWDYFKVNKIGVVPLTSKADRINAARVVIDNCEFHETNCEDGLAALRAWIYEWDEDRKEYSVEPRHDWASHPSDGFSYGCQIMRERTLKHEPQPVKFAQHRTINQMIERQKRKRIGLES